MVMMVDEVLLLLEIDIEKTDMRDLLLPGMREDHPLGTMDVIEVHLLLPEWREGGLLQEGNPILHLVHLLAEDMTVTPTIEAAEEALLLPRDP